MARLPRYRRAPGSLEPGQLYHVTNRGVDRCPLFHSDLDRILLLSMLAEACVHFGAVCHAWCLMTNHFHLVVEDTYGVLSQILHRVESAYARYFNDTRPQRRGGPLFESRFRAELIDTTQYFEDACAYVLLNPLRTAQPLSPSAEAYRWSSAAMMCSDTTPAASMALLIEPFGGIDAILEALPRSARASSRELRRKRLEALVSGAWLEREHLLAGRTPEAYRRVLASRAAERGAKGKQVTSEQITPVIEVATGVRPMLASRPPFRGFEIGAAEAEVRTACDELLPSALASSASQRSLILYALHRFTSASLETLAKAVGVAKDVASGIVDRFTAQRIADPTGFRLLWRLEWTLRWRLRAAPCRP